MADPSAPTVPNSPGVPAVGPGSTTAPATTAVTTDAPIVVHGIKSKWAILNADGSKALHPDSFREIDDEKEFNNARFPVEQGGFQSYNKVETPEEVKLALMISGDDSKLSEFIDAVNTILADLNLYRVLTPGRTYNNMNMVHRGISRSATSGVTLLTVRVAFIEIRDTVQTAFTNVTDPTAADNVNGGSVQGVTPTAVQTPGSPPQ